jgi:hypothetical protein
LFYFAATLFVSALLLFLVQPMVAKMTLPLLGGTPAVWNTCMVFYQGMLLFGYLYAHVAPKRLGLRVQAGVHLVLMLAPLAVLPISIHEWGSPPGDANPIPWLLLMLSATVGLPFFVVSTTAPLLQTWFANTGHPASKDPYFLYAASNMGSMIALLGYPFLMEPTLRLAEQSWFWFSGYAVLVVLITGCAIILWRRLGSARDGSAPVIEAEESPDARPPATPVTRSRRLRWIALSFVPSSLLLGFTTFLTTDIAAVPLLWVVPLSLYLLTFIIVFSRRPVLPHWLNVRLFGILVLPFLVLMLARSYEPLWLVLPTHLIGFFVAGLMCHGELARDRPDPVHLTEFYLLMSLGGVLGGLFNALVAPLVFNSVLEYPLVLVLACFLLPKGETQRDEKHWKLEDGLVAAGLLALGLGMLWLLPQVMPKFATEFTQGDRRLMGLLGGLAVLSFPTVARPVRFGLCLLAVSVVGVTSHTIFEHVIHQQRSFFGVHRVMLTGLDPKTGERRYHELVHGNISHGKQFLDPNKRRQPVAYYHRSGPLGDAFRLVKERLPGTPLAVIGLGSGGIATYLQPGQPLTYYEIDPVVERIARDPNLFTYLTDAGNQINVVLGDGRLTLARAPDGHYGMLIVDAFSSDAIPLHLLTREALQMYLTKLREDGVMVFHISNRYLWLENVLGDLSGDLGLYCMALYDRDVTDKERNEEGKAETHYVTVARPPSHLGKLADATSGSRWQHVKARPGVPVWTDDFSNILGVVIWKQFGWWAN